MKEEGEKKFDQRNNPLFIQVDTTVNNHWTQQLTNTTTYYVDFLSFFYQKSHKNCDTLLQWGCQGFFSSVSSIVWFFFSYCEVILFLITSFPVTTNILADVIIIYFI